MINYSYPHYINSSLLTGGRAQFEGPFDSSLLGNGPRLGSPQQPTQAPVPPKDWTKEIIIAGLVILALIILLYILQNSA